MLHDDDAWAVLEDFLDHETDLAGLPAREIELVRGTFHRHDEVRDYLFSPGSCFPANAGDAGYRGWLAEGGRRSQHDGSTS